MTSTITALQLPRPLRVTVIDDSDLAQAGVRTLLAPYGDRVRIIDNGEAIAAPGEVDVILFEPRTRSSMALSMMRDLQQRADAAVAAFSWCDESTIPSTMPQLSKNLTASQLTVQICALAAAHAAGTTTYDGACLVDQLPRVTPPASSGPSRLSADGDRTERPALPGGLDLTGREHDVLRLIARGLTNIEVGEVLGLSINSVKTYVRSAYRKIGVTRRPQAVIWAIAHGFDEEPKDGLAG